MDITKNETGITPECVERHGLQPEEYQKILDLIGRTPTLTELGIFSAMWNEHCSYKSSKKWLRTLPVQGEQVIQGPGENAGVIDIGDDQAIIFKMESHNHPSFIEPYQGAATGVGGILRDVFTMGARPIATLNSLHFGNPDAPRTRYLMSGVVSGIGGYGNSFGVPTVGGAVDFHAHYDGNILVNVMAIGLANTDKIFYSRVKDVDLPIVYLGAKTGCDGIHGASMASAEFANEKKDQRPTVQVGDPFTGKRLLEACLELMATGDVIAIQDMGAAGLTCSAVEMGAKSNLGVELDLDAVPCRENGMTAYEIMLSESQERMLMVIHPDKQEEAKVIFDKWGLDYAVVGRTISEPRFIVRYKDKVEADLPIRELGDEAPEYDRPWSAAILPEKLQDIPLSPDYAGDLCKIIGSPGVCSRRWIWEQYDYLIMGGTVQSPGGDAAVICIDDSMKGIAACVDVTSRYCAADPFEGGKQAVAEVWRNLTSVGAQPLAVTDNLNFGNPQRPEIMGQLVKCIQGIGDACRVLDFPVVSGNVSLYNENDGKSIPPTPAIGGVGLLPDVRLSTSIALKEDMDIILLIGNLGEHLDQSIYLREIHGREEGLPPKVDLEAERRNGNFVRWAIRSELLNAVHDISDGGMIVALVEMAIAGGTGASIDLLADINSMQGFLFGEDQARYLVTCKPDILPGLFQQSVIDDVPLRQLGTVTGKHISVAGTFSVSLDKLKQIHESWFPLYMDGENSRS